MNKVILIGRLTKDAELRKTNNGISVTAFSIAVQRNFKNANGEYEADFINCISYRNTAEYIAKYAAKGSMIAIEGKLQTRSYEKDGKKVFVQEVICDNAQLLNNKKENKETTINETEKDGFDEFAEEIQDEFELNENDLPF